MLKYGNLLDIKKDICNYIDVLATYEILRGFDGWALHDGFTFKELCDNVKLNGLRQCDIKNRLKKMLRNGTVNIDRYNENDEPVYYLCID